MSPKMKLIYLLVVLILAFGSLSTAAFTSDSVLEAFTSIENVSVFVDDIGASGATHVIAGDCDGPLLPIC